MRKHKLATAVKFAIGMGVAMGSVSQISIATAEESVIEEVMVTGSRIQRADIDGASPVASISLEDMKLEGNLTVADALRNTTLNSFGSFSEKSGSSAMSQASVSLRGAGSNRTLVLMDGRRMAGSPTLGGSSANLNAIPSAAVERVEILKDGSSSIYGSDAVAGVVNVILKDDFEGLELSIGVGDREHDPGLDSQNFTLLGGWNSDKGNVTVAFDHQQRDGISDGARPYTAAWMRDGDGDGIIQAYSETDGWSIYGATVASPDFASATASPLCDSLDGPFMVVAADTDWSEGSTYCMYPYANVSYNKASIDRNSLFVNMDYQISEDIEWFGRATIVQNKTFGRYAPPAAPWNNMKEDNPHNTYNFADFVDPDDEDADEASEITTTGYFRWVDIGTRDGNAEDTNQDYLMGFRGDNGDISWEIYYHQNTADNKDVGEYYLSYGGLAENLANDIDLGSEEGVANMSSTTLTQNRGEFKQYFAGAGFDKFSFAGGEMAHYVGVEMYEQDYSSVYDAQSEAGLVGGSAGNSAAGSRDVTALFYEGMIPLVDDFEVNISARFDDYSDFGSQVSPKISAKWTVNDDLILRTSFSNGFRAPQLDEMYAATSFSAEDTIDYVACDANGTPDAECPEKQVTTYYRSNSNLEAEESDYFNIGAIWAASDNLEVRVDYFDMTIDNVIQTQTVQSLVNKERAGTLVETDTFYLDRTAGGVLLEAGTGYNNGRELSISGVDLDILGTIDTAIGQIDYSWVNSYLFSYEAEISYEGPVQDTAGWEAQPDYKSSLTTNWSSGNHSVTYNANYIISTYGRDESIQGTELLRPIDHLEHWLVHNLTYTYDMDDLGSISFAAVNLTDEDPVLDVNGKYSYEDLYNNFGREYRVNYTISF